MVVEIRLNPDKLKEFEKIKAYFGLESNVEMVRTGLALLILMYRAKVNNDTILISEKGSVASFFENHLDIEEIINIGKGK